MSFITLDDFIDTYFKVVQRGNGFFLSKLTFNKEKRTKSAFNNSSFQSSNFWSIPKVKERWNKDHPIPGSILGSKARKGALSSL